MKNYKNYEKIKRYLESHTKPIASDLWNETIAQALSLTVPEIEAVKKQMLLDELLYEYEETMYFIDKIHYLIGNFTVVREQFGFVETTDDSLYINSEHFNHALDRDDVLISVHHGDKNFGKIITSVKRHRDYLLGTMKKVKGKLYFFPYETKVYQRVNVRDVTVSIQENDRVIGAIIQVDKEITVDVISVLGQADEPGMDVLSVLYEHDFEIEFNDDVKAIIPTLPTEPDSQDFKGRIDHRDQYVITIDGDDAKDLDDAIYMESRANGYRLYVHIADVAHYVKSGSVLDESAYGRTSSIYMVDRVVPMLPKEISNGICSLHPHVDRLAMTVQMDITFQGEVIDYHIYESVIQSKQRLSYTEVNSGENLQEAEPMIEMMLDCASRLNHNRRQEGSIDFDSDETEFVIDHEGKVLDVFKKERGLGEEMIEAFMVLTNEVVAKHCRYQSIPILYRIHPKPEKDRLQELSHTLRILGYRMRGSLENIHPKTLQKALKHFEDKDEAPVVSRLVLRSMAKARYDKEPSGHFGLALEDYTHFTSPIRRYPDLLLHQRIKQYVFKSDFKNYDADEAFVAKAGQHVSDKERSILEAEREVEKMKKAQFMQDKVGERYVGYISGVTNFGIFVELANTVEGLIHVRDMKDDYYFFDPSSQKLMGERTGVEYRLGKRVEVELVSVDMVEHVVNFKLIKEKRKKKKGNFKKKGGKRNRGPRSKKPKSK